MISLMFPRKQGTKTNSMWAIFGHDSWVYVNKQAGIQIIEKVLKVTAGATTRHDR